VEEENSKEMMIKGIGIDLINIERFETLKNKKEFLNQILTKNELKICAAGKKKNRCYVLLFTVKEAIFKACRIGLSFGSYWRDIEICNGLSISYTGRFRRIKKIHVSSGCSKRYALSFAIKE